MLYLDLTMNLALLVALSLVSGFIDRRWPRTTRLGLLLQGALFGGTAVMGMLRPLNLGPGLIFDGRSVMVSLCALFFGPWAAAAAVIMTIACRIGLGGAGMLTGSLVVLSSAGIGLLVRSRSNPNVRVPSTRTLYLFGLAVHVATLAMMFTLPAGTGLDVIMRIGPAIMLLYPLATALSGKILSDQVETARILEALREREQRYHLLFNSGNDPVFVHELDASGTPGRFTEVNDAACRRLGYGRDQLLRMSPHDIEASEGEQAGRVMKMLAEEGRAVYETAYIGKSGEKIPLEVSGRVFEAKGKRYVLSIARDITERRRAEEALRASEDRYRDLVESSHDLICTHDLEGRVLSLNPMPARLLGYTPEEIIGKNLRDLLAPEMRDRFEEYLGEIQRNRAARGLMLVQSRNGERRIWEYNNTLRVEGVSQPIVRGTAHDVTERKLAERKLIEKVGELERFQDTVVGRELVMIELKKEVNSLLRKAGREEKYILVE